MIFFIITKYYLKVLDRKFLKMVETDNVLRAFKRQPYNGSTLI